MKLERRDSGLSEEALTVDVRRAIVLAWWGLAMTVAGAASTAWAAGELSTGIEEILDHWWSTAAILPLLLGIAMMSGALARLGRSSGSRRAR